MRDVYEAVGHAKAYDYLLQLEEKEVLEEDDILTLHKLFYQQIDSEQAGRYRNVKVYISGSHYQVAPVAKIETEMKKLTTWYNNNENKLHPIELAAELHRRFVFIHPFVDGNGRLARLLMNLSLLRNGYTLAIIPALLRHEYIATLEMAHKDSVPFYEFIADRVINTQYDLLRLLKDDDTVNDTANDTVKGEVNALTATELAVLHAIFRRPPTHLRTNCRKMWRVATDSCTQREASATVANHPTPWCRQNRVLGNRRQCQRIF